jgi:hypothetical protein
VPRQRLLFEHRLHLGAEPMEPRRISVTPAAIQIRVPAGSEITDEDS